MPLRMRPSSGSKSPTTFVREDADSVYLFIFSFLIFFLIFQSQFAYIILLILGVHLSDGTVIRKQ